MGLMTRYSHPRWNDGSLEAALHALADPCRFAIVRRLAGQSGELSCQSAAQAGAVPKSTVSNHFKILRGAGLIRTRPAGREYLSSLRRAEFDARFPALPDTGPRHPDRQTLG